MAMVCYNDNQDKYLGWRIPSVTPLQLLIYCSEEEYFCWILILSNDIAGISEHFKAMFFTADE